mmetsp:Transcript_16807/g.32834  ORF Transcript_16807/g.32834 Transcript_16807/m.32834 type:complete len:216 (+) Transcript_16807:319-966(+)
MTSQVEEARMPSFTSFLPTCRPGLFFSTMKAVMPLCPLLGSAFAKTTKTSASMAFEIQHLLPSMIQSPPSFFAAVFNAKASEPLPGSERQNDATVSLESLERYSCFCSSVPYTLNAVISSVFWMSISTATDGSILATSSTAKHADVKFKPTPPYSVGASIPIKPFSKSAATTSGSSLSASSIFCTRGARKSRANVLTESRIISSSSDQDVTAGRA